MVVAGGGCGRLPGDRFDDRLLRNARYVGVDLDLAVNESDDAIGNCVELAHLVVDEEDADSAFLGQLPHEREELFHLGALKAGGRFVEQKVLGLAVSGHRDLEELSGGNGVVAEATIDVDFQVELASQVAGHLAHAPSVQGPTLREFIAQEDVLRDRQIRQEGKLLVDGGDAAP